jgi:hypothetical protein
MIDHTLMSDEELRMNTYIREDEVGKYAIFKGEEMPNLEDRSITFQRAIACRETTYCRAKRQNSKRSESVVKLS